ncbi:MAG: Rrf2 family transcriptional regulator [Clostridiales bacterium]|nr:Rrf2 family transcriptional regulator [Clostridiales bacterium]
MKISTKGRYALRVIIDLAEQNSDSYITLKEISKRQGISMKYLESIISLLVKGDILIGLRGKGGGYKLTKSPDQITAAQILILTEGSIAPIACLDAKAGTCSRAGECKTLPMWIELDRRITEYLQSVTIADLAASGDDIGHYII